MREKKENKCKGLWLVIAAFFIAVLMTQGVVIAADSEDSGDYQDQNLERVHKDDEFSQQELVEDADYNQMSSDNVELLINEDGGNVYKEVYSSKNGHNPAYASFFNYNPSTKILTVNGYQGNGDLFIRDANDESPMKVVFKGKNYFEQITMLNRGVGQLNYIFSGDDEVNCGMIFLGGHSNLTIESGIYNIVQQREYDLYQGIHVTDEEEYHPLIKILGGTVNITSKDFDARIRMGINVQYGNLEIRNANVNIDLGSAGWAYGLYSAGGLYGGGLIIENSNVRIKTVGTNYSCSIWTYNPEFIGDMSFYVGPRVANKKIDASKVFEKYESMNNLQVCGENLIISTTPIDVDIAFDDVKVGDWYYEPVKSMFQKGIMTGIDDYTFGSTQNLARAQFAALLYKLEGSPSVEYDNRFSDVADGQWYTKPILWAAQNGIVNGYQDGRFGVGDSINREQIATMLYSYSKFKGYDLSQSGNLSGFPDNSNVSAYAKKSLQWAVGVGFISGTNGKLDPQGSAVRAQCATIMMRYLKAYE
ncbi:S-layer homology domain-containing protein [Ohessyouella blattaphilus]|uniref:S-layer homology domain-containing protein n=1 Tax=Ohessyouella blattaphilus TaxID=2949333 RepID=A0ABT1ED74_9FIRM|nr:S-layer homology domain-containing protein [Ohessyouella blattaphilus]MCP1108635.1 S-layer homology domain-containing protein [Ohessyouella blattaphilus]MCR8562029.1 S-layer homology domain-containing protein [Ohessyouella blattaphilus]